MLIQKKDAKIQEKYALQDGRQGRYSTASGGIITTGPGPGNGRAGSTGARAAGSII